MTNSFKISKSKTMIKVKYKDLEVESDASDSYHVESLLHIVADFIHTVDHSQRMQNTASRLEDLSEMTEMSNSNGSKT